STSAGGAVESAIRSLRQSANGNSARSAIETVDDCNLAAGGHLEHCTLVRRSRMLRSSIKVAFGAQEQRRKRTIRNAAQQFESSGSSDLVGSGILRQPIQIAVWP